MGKTLRIILRIVSYIALLLLLLSSFSHWISPWRTIVFSYLGLFFPFILAGNLLVLLCCLIFRQWRQSIISVLVLLICSGSILTYFPINKHTDQVPEDCIKLVTYNTMRFEYLRPHTKENPNPIVQYLIDSEADIICIQEYGASNDKNKLDLNDLKKVFKRTPHCHVEHLMFPYEGEELGLAIFSRFPILNTKKIPYDSQHNGSFIAELDINGRKVTLINNHLESNRLSIEERVVYEDLTKEPTMTELKSFTQAMFKRLTPAFKIRAKQAQIIEKEIHETQNPYIIVCGDFNDTPISYTRHKIKGDLKDAFVESGQGMGVTFNKYRFLFRIDYILYSKNMKSYNCTVGKLRNSDHYPLTTYLRFID